VGSRSTALCLDKLDNQGGDGEAVQPACLGRQSREKGSGVGNCLRLPQIGRANLKQAPFIQLGWIAQSKRIGACSSQRQAVRSAQRRRGAALLARF